MDTALDDPSLIQHENQVCIPHRSQPMRNDDAGASRERASQAAQDASLGMRVHRAESVIEDKDRWILRQGAGNGSSLLLTSREIDAPFADQRLVTLGQGG